MIRLIAIAMGVAALSLLQGCASQCRGDSCTRPEPNAKTLVIWWPPHMRVEAGPDAERPDHQVVPLDR